MLKIQNLTITYRRDGRVLADHFDLVLNSLDKAVLIGEEGNGKSTLLKWIHDPALIEDYADAEGICLPPGSGDFPRGAAKGQLGGDKGFVHGKPRGNAVKDRADFGAVALAEEGH